MALALRRAGYANPRAFSSRREPKIAPSNGTKEMLHQEHGGAMFAGISTVTDFAAAVGARHGTNPCAKGCITSQDIFGLAQKLSLVVDEIVAG